MDDFAQWSEVAKLFAAGGGGGTVIGIIWAGISLWGKYRRTQHEDNATTAGEWQETAQEYGRMIRGLEKRLQNLHDKHHSDMRVVLDELKACNDDRAKLHAQNDYQQKQITEQGAKIAELEDHVGRLSGSIRVIPK